MRSVFRRAVAWYDRQTTGIRLLIGAVATAAPYYLAALLSYQVSAIAQFGGSRLVAVHALAVTVVTVIVVFVSRYLVMLRDEKRREHALRMEALSRAYSLCDRVLSWRIAKVNNAAAGSEDLLWALTASVDGLQQIVSAAYEALEGTYGDIDPDDPIDFEVTFMTKSYVDGFITIPAAANRDGRQPRSMVLRRQQPNIYDNTITAMVYREPRPVMHIIEDTMSGGDYEELYPGQRKRIRSSVIFPVVSDRNVLLGTLVAHCDKKRFFGAEQEDFWTDWFEIFAKRLAAEVVKINRVVEPTRHQNVWATGITLHPPY